MPSKRVVLLTYQFPPMGSAGSLRMLAFSRHLHEFGWDPIVVTIGRLGVAGEDPSLLARLDGATTVHRWFTPLAGAWALRRKTGQPEPWSSPPTPRAGEGAEPVASGAGARSGPAGGANAAAGIADRASARRGPSRVLRSFARTILETALAVPDHAVLWSLAAGIRTGNWMRAHGVRAIVTTSPPYSTVLAGILARELSGGVWLADLRDPWSTFKAVSSRGVKDRAGRTLYRQALGGADRVLANTQRFRDAILEDPRVPPERVLVMPNGFDADEIEAAQRSARAAAAARPGAPLTILHAGTLYKGMRHPIEVLRAMSRILQGTGGEGNGARGLRLVLPGDSSYHEDPELRETIDSLGLAGRVESPGYLPHDQILAMEAEADVLLLIQGGGFHMQVPSKAYEYLAMGRPVLAITGDGATADLVRTSPIGRVVPPGDEEGIAAYLRERLTAPRPDGFAPPPAGVLSRRQLAGRLASVLDELTAAHDA